MADTRNTRFAPSKETLIAGFTLLAIFLHVALHYASHFPALTYNLPLFAASLLGGAPLVWELLKKLLKRQFGSDLLAGISIVTAVALREYLVAAIVVLMLSGGEALEAFATARASSVLDALARRMPNVAHRKEATGLVDAKLADICIGDELTVLPHEICPVDGTVLEGHGVMDEAYLTGEPYEISKTPGSTVISGAINGEKMLVIRGRVRLPAADLGRHRPGTDRSSRCIERRTRRVAGGNLAGFLTEGIPYPFRAYSFQTVAAPAAVGRLAVAGLPAAAAVPCSESS